MSSLNRNDGVLLSKYFATSVILLPILVLLAIILCPKVNFGVLSSSIVNADVASFLYLNDLHQYSHPAISQMMIWLTQYGREVVWSIAIILLFIIGGTTGKKTAVVMGLAMLVLIPLVNAANEIAARPRPIIPQEDFLIAADSEYAFPSGHATIVSAGAVVVLILFRDSARKLAVSLSLTIEAALVCFSRVYVGGHYPLDVFG